jgi:hypothetical protein
MGQLPVNGVGLTHNFTAPHDGDDKIGAQYSAESKSFTDNFGMPSLSAKVSSR